MAGSKRGRPINKKPVPTPESNINALGSPIYICPSCGSSYGRQKGLFPATRGKLYMSSNFLHICNNCVDRIYNEYLSLYGDEQLAIKRICMKFDLYWNTMLFETAKKQSVQSSSESSLIRLYIAKTNLIGNQNKCYDDTIEETFGVDKADLDKTAFDFANGYYHEKSGDGNFDFDSSKLDDDNELIETLPLPEITQNEIEFWGPGYTKSMYAELEQRKVYWVGELKKRGVDLDDVGAMALLRQICNLEIDINKDRAAGKPVDKSINTLNTLIGSASLKPSQRKEELDASTERTPFGVWIKMWEECRPIPDTPVENVDRNGLIRTVLVWFFGHLCKMVGIKNSYSRLYEEEIERLRVEFPEYSDEDDESMLADIFGSSGDVPDD